jgi:hypothetical protein
MIRLWIGVNCLGIKEDEGPNAKDRETIRQWESKCWDTSCNQPLDIYTLTECSQVCPLQSYHITTHSAILHTGIGSQQIQTLCFLVNPAHHSSRNMWPKTSMHGLFIRRTAAVITASAILALWARSSLCIHTSSRSVRVDVMCWSLRYCKHSARYEYYKPMFTISHG